MSDVRDVQMHGAGNRFLIHFGDTPPATLRERLDGADGVLIVSDDAQTDAYMRIINADGNEAGQCGNGLRCVALHLVRSHLTEGPTVRIRTRSGIHHCVVHEDRNEVDVTLCRPDLSPSSCSVDVQLLHDLPEMTFVHVGNPNAILWTDDDPIEVRQKWGEGVVHHRAFKQGINLHVARRDAEQYATCASWERGVGATLASGTGGASVFAASGSRELFFVSSLGGTLTYRYDNDGSIVMRGPAGYV